MTFQKDEWTSSTVIISYKVNNKVKRKAMLQKEANLILNLTYMLSKLGAVHY